eukprot:343555-Alexandrium_andersonii.AAC.1
MPPSRCLAECRLTLEGSELVLGVKTSAVQGADLREKISAVGSMPAEQLASLAKNHGFIAASQPGTLLAIDNQFICVTLVLGEAPCVGLRWSFVVSEKTVPPMIDMMLASFP